MGVNRKAKASDMSSRSKFTITLLVSLLISVSLLQAACGSRGQAKAKAGAANTNANATPTAVSVTTAAAITRELPRFVEATGSLAADEQTDVAPVVSGRVIAVGVDLGSYVQRGAVLARLDDADARLRLEGAQAAAAQARSSVTQAEARIGLRPGQTFDPNRVAEVSSARVALDLADKQLRRFERLIESGDVSRSAYDQQQAQRDQLRSQYDAALAAARQNNAAIQTARAAANGADAQVAQARKAVSDVVVYAPISGYVAERPVDPGEYVSTSQKVATIVRTNPLRVRIDIPEQLIANVQPGQSISVTTSSYADQSFAGRVARISPNVTAASRTLTVEAEVANDRNQLKPGQFATVRILLPKSEAAVLVPARALRTEGTVNRLYVVRDGRVEERVVQIGQAEGDLVEIKTGLSAGELVATDNLEQLRDGVPVSQ